MKIINFFDKLEDKIRGLLSHFPIIYAFIGGVGVVLFWRGVWHTADAISATFVFQAADTIDMPSLWDGLISIAASLIFLLPSGLFVSHFIGNEIIISGLRGEKKLAEKTEKELKTETGAIAEIHEHVIEIRDMLSKKDE